MSQEEEEKYFERSNAVNKMDFSKLQKLVLVDLKNYPYQLARRFIGKYKREDIGNYLMMPEIQYNQIQLRYISKYLFNISTHYRRLITYFANLVTFDYVVEPYGVDPDNLNVKKLKKAYQKIVELLDVMNLKHEFLKIATVAFREDVFFGYIHQNNDSFFIQPLLSDFCKISSVEDGVYNFAFDFTYFDAFPNRLYMFPEEFQVLRKQYEKDGQRFKELSSQNTICIKINEDIEYVIPPFVGIFPTLLDIQDFKDLEMQRTEIGNYKILFQKIPMRENSTNNNDYSLTLDHVTLFHNNISGVLPEQVALITSPMDIEEIEMVRDHPDQNLVETSTKQFWDATGVSQMLFSGGKNGAIGMTNSVKTDEVIGFALLRQIERWTNRFLKRYNDKYKFKTTFPNISIFNKDNMVQMYLSAAQYGMPVKSYLAASMGITPSSLQNMTILENQVLEMHSNMIPLASSHTQSSNQSSTAKKGGRPEKNEEELTDEGEKSKDEQKNTNKPK